MAVHKPIKPENHFFLPDGTSIKSLRHLSIELERMSHSTFYHHVTPNKNDFATWVDEAVGDSDLAKRIRNSKTSKAMKKKIDERIRELAEVEEPIKILQSIIKQEAISPRRTMKKAAKKTKKKKKTPLERSTIKVAEKKQKDNTKIPAIRKRVAKLKKKELHPSMFYMRGHPLHGAHDFVMGLAIGLIIGLFVTKLFF